jgi:hypothetical protein
VASHTLLWRSDDGPPSGAAGLLGWTRYSLESNPYHFFRNGEGQINKLATDAVQCAVARGCDVTIGWGPTPNFRTTPAHQLEEMFRRLRPAVIALPERPGKTDRWAISSHGTPASVPAAGIQQALSDQVAAMYPQWQHGLAWNATAFLLRHDISAEQLGLVESAKPTPDDILAEIATDPQVRAAADRADPALPETLRALIAARLKVQAEREIPADRRVTHFSGEIEGWLLPVTMKLARGEGPAAFDNLRRQLWAT